MPSGGENAALPIEEAAIEADLRRALSGIDSSAPGAAVALWRAFLEHAARPLEFGDAYDPDKDNDQLTFDVAPAADGVYVDIRRRIGVVRSSDGDYQGTIVSGVNLKVAGSDAWSGVEPQTIADYGPTAGGVDSFRRAVEASDAFRALTTSPVLELVANAGYG